MSNAQKPAGFKSELGSGNDLTKLQQAAFDAAMREAKELRARWPSLKANRPERRAQAAKVCGDLSRAVASIWRCGPNSGGRNHD